MTNPISPEQRGLLRHFLAALAYRTQKALRDASPSFADYTPLEGVRTPKTLVKHMTSVLGYARTHFIGGRYHAEPLETMQAEIERFHEMLELLSEHLRRGDALLDTTPARMLQGPFSDAMTHAGQLALLRRLSGDPIPPENFIVADIDAERLGVDQADPVSPDEVWEEPPAQPPRRIG